MPTVEYATTIGLPREVVWEFVKDMSNWAPFLTGYQKHEIIDETDSVWTLKGDVGVLSRTVQFRAHVTEWSGPDRVAFTLIGMNETLDGGGVLEMRDMTDEGSQSAREEQAAPGGIVARFFRWLFELVNGKGAQRQISAGAGGKRARLTFTLRMDAGGPMGPLVNAMLGPALMPAAEDLANKIAAHLEKSHAL